MSDLQVKSKFDRRPSFWKTPITHSPSVTGQKRNYSEINNDKNKNTHSNSSNNPNKKRRLLTDLEIQNIAKCGGFSPSNIIIAVQESDGFQWFKRTPNSQLAQTQISNIKHEYLQKYWPKQIQTETETESNNVLREISKDELKLKSKHKKAAKAINPNEFNRAQAAMALQKAAKTRRNTAPVAMLQQLIHDSNASNKQHKRHQKRKKKTRKIVQYKTKKEIIKKKVKRKRRVVSKKKTRTLTLKIVTEFSDVCVPSFPVPNLKLNVLFFCDVKRPFVAIENFESSLIDSFVLPLMRTYGNHSKESNPFAFITRNVLQFLLEIKHNLNALVHNGMDWGVQNVNVTQSIKKYKEIILNKNPKQSQTESLSQSLAPFEEDSQCLSDECSFYERELAVITAFCEHLKHEMDFTKHVQTQLRNETYLKAIFDFDLGHSKNLNTDNNNRNCKIVLNDNEFLYQMASEIDEIYNEYCIDFVKIECEQRRFETELNAKEERIAELKRFYGKDILHKSHAKLLMANGNANNNNGNNVRDKLVFANFVEANKGEMNEQNENSNICCDLRALNGYQMRENDTLQMEID